MAAPTNTTRDSLIEAAIQVFAAKPTATLAEVAEAAGVKRVTLHRLFGTREELLKEIAIRSLAEMDHACEKAVEGTKSALDALRAIVEALVPVGDRCYFLWEQSDVWEEPSVAKQTARQDKELEELIEMAKAEGSIAADIPTAWIIASIVSVVYAALTTSRSGDIAVNDAGKLAVRTLFAGIEAKPTKKKERRRKR